MAGSKTLLYDDIKPTKHKLLIIRVFEFATKTQLDTTARICPGPTQNPWSSNSSSHSSSSSSCSSSSNSSSRSSSSSSISSSSVVVVAVVVVVVIVALRLGPLVPLGDPSTACSVNRSRDPSRFPSATAAKGFPNQIKICTTHSLYKRTFMSKYSLHINLDHPVDQPHKLVSLLICRGHDTRRRSAEPSPTSRPA
jgi:hypothetical protein